MKRYRGIKQENGTIYVTVHTVGKPLELINPKHLRGHSDVFDYSQQGLLQLACAILVDYAEKVDELTALDCYEAYAEYLGKHLEPEAWVISNKDIDHFLNNELSIRFSNELQESKKQQKKDVLSTELETAVENEDKAFIKRIDQTIRDLNDRHRKKIKKLKALKDEFIVEGKL